VKFSLRVLLDHWWFLQLKKDGTFEYIHWSGWGPKEGNVLDKGTYSIHTNKLELQSENADSDLEKFNYYLIMSQSQKTGQPLSIDCVEHRKRTLCLYRKSK
jgi:hypothetical protein